MNSRIALLALALSLVLGATVAGQTSSQPTPIGPSQAQPLADSPWQLVFYPAGDADVVRSINNLVDQGFTPVGIEYTFGESLAVFVVRDDSAASRRWAIAEYTDWNTLEDDITVSIRDGFVPMDISRYGDALAVLWVETDLPLDGWRISTSENSPAAQSLTRRNFESSGFTLYGVSVNEDLVWYLFLRLGDAAQTTQLLGYALDSEAIQTGLVAAASSGWRPTGIASTESTFYLSFVK